MDPEVTVRNFGPATSEPSSVNPIGPDCEQVEIYVVSVSNSNSSRLNVNRNKVLAAEAAREGVAVCRRSTDRICMEICSSM